MLNEIYLLSLNAQVEMNAQIKAFERANEEKKRQMAFLLVKSDFEENIATKHKRYIQVTIHLRFI